MQNYNPDKGEVKEEVQKDCFDRPQIQEMERCWEIGKE